MVRTLDDPGLDDGDRKLITDVAMFGFHIVQIPAGDLAEGSADELAGWSFTVGLHHRFDHPELVLFGLPDPVRGTILSDLGQRVVRGERLDLEAPLEGVIEGYPLRFGSVRPRWYTPFLGYALWFYAGEPFPVWQVSWPDRSGAFPWDRAEPDHPSILQPLLGEKSTVAARSAPFLRAMRMAWEDLPEEGA